MSHGPAVLDHFERPRNLGVLPPEAPDVGSGEAGEARAGDVVKFQVRVEGDRVVEARFRCFGCTATIAASSLATEVVRGRSVAVADVVGAAEIASLLALPADKRRSGELVALAVRRAVADWRRKQEAGSGPARRNA